MPGTPPPPPQKAARLSLADALANQAQSRKDSAAAAAALYSPPAPVTPAKPIGKP